MEIKFAFHAEDHEPASGANNRGLRRTVHTPEHWFSRVYGSDGGRRSRQRSPEKFQGSDAALVLVPLSHRQNRQAGTRPANLSPPLFTVHGGRHRCPNLFPIKDSETFPPTSIPRWKFDNGDRWFRRSDHDQTVSSMRKITLGKAREGLEGESEGGERLGRGPLIWRSWSRWYQSWKRGK